MSVNFYFAFIVKIDFMLIIYRDISSVGKFAFAEERLLEPGYNVYFVGGAADIQ